MSFINAYLRHKLCQVVTSQTAYQLWMCFATRYPCHGSGYKQTHRESKCCQSGHTPHFLGGITYGPFQNKVFLGCTYLGTFQQQIEKKYLYERSTNVYVQPQYDVNPTWPLLSVWQNDGKFTVSDLFVTNFKPLLHSRHTWKLWTIYSFSFLWGQGLFGPKSYRLITWKQNDSVCKYRYFDKISYDVSAYDVTVIIARQKWQLFAQRILKRVNHPLKIF